jgi:hypothetical protein
MGLRERTDKAKKMEDGIRQNRMHEVNERTRGGLEKEGTRLTARRGGSLKGQSHEIFHLNFPS